MFHVIEGVDVLLGSFHLGDRGVGLLNGISMLKESLVLRGCRQVPEGTEGVIDLQETGIHIIPLTAEFIIGQGRGQ